MCSSDLEDAMKRIPSLEKVGIRKFFNGPESFTADQRYILGPAPEVGGVFVAAGFNSIGIQSGGGAGMALAHWITEGEPPFDLWDVDINRLYPHQNTTHFLIPRVSEALGLLYAMHWPFKQYETSRGVRKTALHDRITAAGACFGEVAGWERPNWFAKPGQKPHYEYTFGKPNWFENSRNECRAVREAVGLFDQSAFAKFTVKGRDAMKLLNRVSVNEMDVAIGKVVYTQWCNEKGGIEADLTATRISRNEYLVVTAAATQLHDRRHLENAIRDDESVAIVDVTSGTSTIGLMGPNSRALLQSLTPDDISNSAFPFGTSREIEVGPARIRATRITYVGELGYELYVPAASQPALLDALMSIGHARSLRHIGNRALDSLRLEKSYGIWSTEFTQSTTPGMCGLDRHVEIGRAHV